MRLHRQRVGLTGVVVQHQAPAQFGRVFALEVVQARVRRIADQRAVVRDRLTVRGVRGEHLRHRPRIAGPDETAGQRQAECGVRRVVADREHVEPEAVAPEAARYRDQPERVPEVRTALGQHLRVIGDAPLQQRHQRRMRVQAHRAAQRRIEIGAIEQPLEPGDVVHVRVRDVDRTRRRAVVVEVRAQRLGAAVDHQQRRTVALEHAAGRAEFRRVRAADAEKAQGQAHGAPPCNGVARPACVSASW